MHVFGGDGTVCNVFVMDNRQRHFQTFKLLILVICMYAIFVFGGNLYERHNRKALVLHGGWPPFRL